MTVQFLLKIAKDNLQFFPNYVKKESSYFLSQILKATQEVFFVQSKKTQVIGLRLQFESNQ